MNCRVWRDCRSVPSKDLIEHLHRVHLLAFVVERVRKEIAPTKLWVCILKIVNARFQLHRTRWQSRIYMKVVELSLDVSKGRVSHFWRGWLHRARLHEFSGRDI